MKGQGAQVKDESKQDVVWEVARQGRPARVLLGKSCHPEHFMLQNLIIVLAVAMHLHK